MSKDAYRRSVPRSERRGWLAKLKECPVWFDPEGARMIRLPNGRLYAVTEVSLASQVVDALSEKPQPEMLIAVLRRLTTAEEWTEAEAFVEAAGSER